MSTQRFLRAGLVDGVIRSKSADQHYARQAGFDFGTPRNDSDPIARAAAGFAQQLGEVRGACSAGESDEDDAKRVNAAIAMIATNADRLITELVEDAEACGLEASGPWIKNPLVDMQKFEVPETDPEADRADEEHDRKMS